MEADGAQTDSDAQAAKVGLLSVPGLSLRLNVQWTLLANVIYSASQWGVLVAIARVGGTTALGQFALGLAIAAPVFQLADLNLRIAIATDASGEYEFSDYVSLRFVTVPLAFAVVVAIAAGAGFDRETVTVVAMVALSKVVESFTSLCYGVFQQMERLDFMARSMIIQGPGALLATTVLLVLTGNVALALCGYAGTWFVVLILYDVRRIDPGGPADERSGFKSFRWNSNPARIRQLAWVALPLGLAAGVNSLIANIPRYLVASLLGTASLGVFASVAYLITLLAVVTSTLASAVVPRLSKSYASGDRRGFSSAVTKLLSAGLAVGVIATLAAAVVGEPLLDLVYGPEFASRSILVGVMASGAAITTFRLAGASLQAARRFRPYLFSLAPVLLVVGVGGYGLTDAYGMPGAAWSLAAGYALGVAVLIALLWRVVSAMEPLSGEQDRAASA